MFSERVMLAPDGEDDLYGGFNEYHPALDPKSLRDDEGFQQAVLKSSYGRRAPTAGGLRTAAGVSRMGTAGFRRDSMTPRTAMRSSGQQPPPTARPMTAVRGAGYTSVNRSPSATTFDPMNQAKTMTGLFQGKDESTPEARIKLLEKKVNGLLEESIINCHRKEMSLALEKAKDAFKKERTLSKQKEQHSGPEAVPMNIDLTFAVMFNLAVQYTKNGMYSEALNMYTEILKNRSFTNSSRMKLNVGKIYYLQGNFSKAVKFYRMALDQIPTTQRDTRMKIMKNIGLTFVRMNQFTDAITSFEYIMSEKPDFRTGLHLILCHFALGDRDSMKKGFRKMLEIKYKDNLEDQIPLDVDDSNQMVNEVIRNDELRKIQREMSQEHDWSILMSAKLISPVIGESFSQGYEWTVDQIRTAGFIDLANELEINKAVKHLKKREFKEAIDALKTFEKKDSKAASTAATNLSFLYFVQNELSQAEKYADEAINADHLNSGALVNKGNCCYRQHEYERAFEYYKEALASDSTCVEALYNSLLTCKKMNSYDFGLDAGYKLNSIIKNHVYTLYQMATIYESMSDRDQAMDWYTKLLVFVPSDPSLLNRLSDMADAERDRQTSFTYLTEVRTCIEKLAPNFNLQSYRYLPSHIPTIERLAAYYIENQIYEKAIRYLERASAVQPNEIRWPLMIAACHRRGGNYQSALQTYTVIHKKFPENVECLKFLARICADLQLPEAGEYLDKMKKLEKVKELKDESRRRDIRSASRSSRRSAASTNSREGSASSNSSGYITESRNGQSRSSRNSHRSLLDTDIMLTGRKSYIDGLSDDFDTGTERPTTSWRRKNPDEDDFAGDEIIDILPE